MNTHKNALLTPKGRAHLLESIARIGLKNAAQAVGLSTRTARKWQRRHLQQGLAGLLDRSSRPVRCPSRCDAKKLQRAVALRRQRLTYAQIAERVGLSRSSVARACQAAGVARLPALHEQPTPVRR